jgi:ABC-2 type transport system permease protein
MRNALALTQRILKQFSHDPHTVALFIVGPILILWLFSVLLGASSYEPKLAGVNLPSVVVEGIEAQEDCSFIQVSASEAEELLENREIDAVLSMDGKTLIVRVEGADASKTSAVAGVMQAALAETVSLQREQARLDAEAAVDDIRARMDEATAAMGDFRDKLSALPALPGVSMPTADDLPTLDTNVELPDFEGQLVVDGMELSYLHGSDEWNTFDFFGPVFIGIFIFMFVFITSGMSLVTERTGGTMERLLATPIKPWQLVLGYLLGFGLVSLVQAVIVLSACIWLVGFPLEGSLVLVLLITFSMALVSLTLGLLVSGLAKTAFQVIQFMLILVIPQILLSGIFDLSQAPAWMRVLSQCFPITHGAEALRDVMLRGAGLESICLNLTILWGFIIAFFALAALSFQRRQRS